ncbi:MAG: ABC transporter permease [Lachnospiraceae bacterium]|nr:ABC transporter permease [Lachnospiraceae bacterium]
MARYNLNEVLKKREATLPKKRSDDTQELQLDDLSRVKVLSPGRQVIKRFLRNRLAVFGLVTLIIMFVFSYLVPLVYPYSQTQIFYRYDTQNVNYALGKQNDSYNGYTLDDTIAIERTVLNMMNSNIKSMITAGETERVVEGSEGSYVIRRYDEDNNVFVVSGLAMEQVAVAGVSTQQIATYATVGDTVTFLDAESAAAPEDDTEEAGEEAEEETEELPPVPEINYAGLERAIRDNCTGKSGSFEYDGVTYSFERGKAKTYTVTAAFEGIRYTGEPMGAAFEGALETAMESGEAFSFEGEEYHLLKSDSAYRVARSGEAADARIYTRYTIDTLETAGTVSEEFRIRALLAMSPDTKGSFEADGQTYTIARDEDGWMVSTPDGAEYAEFNPFSIRRYTGEDSMEYRLKKAVSSKISEMEAGGKRTDSMMYELPMQAEDSTYVYDEDGNLQYNESELIIERRDTGEYVIRAEQINFVIDLYGAPSRDHLLGTDGDGFDVLARVMYGGRISLMVGFVVVFIEIVLGVIMGGLAGFYGGWVDMLIMRLVDVFYCLPGTAILIIVGAMMDAMRLPSLRRLIVMMAMLGIMGWAGVARLVRGQILSLREQEFMTAAEATGIRVRRRIFSHLVPNVMPQLIVIATLGMGSTIITESTLSFLGLGVKYPYATWGTIINSVSSASAMAYYTHIWIPVGLLICLTVIAFNFVGDGLRDAYDPKSKR